MAKITTKKVKLMEYRKLSELEKLEGNPRIIKDKQFQTLCDSIRDNPEYFEARPLILSDRTGKLVIIAGNQRYKAAKVVKLKEVPTFLIEGLTEEKEREIVIRDNISNGEFDWDIIANVWGDLPLTEWGVDLPEHWIGQVDETDMPGLPDGDKGPFQQITFTLHDLQVEQVESALKVSKSMGGFDSENENSNGNALARVCETFLTDHG